MAYEEILTDMTNAGKPFDQIRLVTFIVNHGRFSALTEYDRQDTQKLGDVQQFQIV
jgi:hypothetical protein